METILSTREKCAAKKRPNSGGEMGPPSLEGVPERAPARLGFIQERFPCQPIDLAAGAMTRARQDMLRKAMLALIAAALVGAGSVQRVSRRRHGRFRRRGRLPPRRLWQRCERGRQLSPGCASRQDARRLANTTSSGLQLIYDLARSQEVALARRLGNRYAGSREASPPVTPGAANPAAIRIRPGVVIRSLPVRSTM